MEIFINFINNLPEPFKSIVGVFEAMLPFFAIIFIFYVIIFIFKAIVFIPTQISRYFKFRRKHKEFEPFEITVKESFKQHYELLEQLENFLKQRLFLSKDFTQGKMRLSRKISPFHWQLYELDFAEAARITSMAVTKYPNLKTHPKFLELQEKLDEQRTHLVATKDTYNLEIHNYNMARRAGILSLLFISLSGNKAKESIFLKEIAPNKLLNEKSEQKIQQKIRPSKTNAEFRQFYDNVLIHKIQVLEELRKECSSQAQKTKRKVQKVMFIAILIAVPFVISFTFVAFKLALFGGSVNDVLKLLFILALILLFIAMPASKISIEVKKKRISDSKYKIERLIKRLYSNHEKFSDYETAFYNQILQPISTFVNDKLEYNQQFMLMDIFMASGLFPEPDKYSGIIGLCSVIDQNRFFFSGVETYFRTNAKHPNPEITPTYALLFKGLFYKINIRKSLKGDIYLLPSSIAKKLKRDINKMNLVMRHQHNNIYKNNVEIRFIDDHDFEKNFSVFTQDSTSTYSLLTPSLRRFLIEIQQEFKDKIYCSFVQGKFYLAIENENLGFKPALSESLLNYDIVEKYFERIRWMFEISQKFEKIMQ